MAANADADHSDLVLFRSRAATKVGELYRYTVRYKASRDAGRPRKQLYLTVRNTESIALRAAYINGPYNLYIDIRPIDWDELTDCSKSPNKPHYRINVRPGQTFSANLYIADFEERGWIVDVVGEQLFSKSASISHEIIVGTSDKAVSGGSSGVTKTNKGSALSSDPLAEHFEVRIQDTGDLWSNPRPRSNEPLHVCILTHGLASNVSSDMLYLKEAIDRACAKTGENVICRGYTGNVTKTDRGVKKLGQRLAEWILTKLLPTYKPSKLSFIGHSLGGLIQSYALGYIQSEHPEALENIELVNFIGMATPFLGISTENPHFVRLALDTGVVGRTGRDLGLSWRIGFKKPLLLTLPTGATHEVLKKFEKRTVYANVANDGIVPLRTSSLLFLDWKTIRRFLNRRQCGQIDELAHDYETEAEVGSGSNSNREGEPLGDPSGDSGSADGAETSSPGAANDSTTYLSRIIKPIARSFTTTPDLDHRERIAKRTQTASTLPPTLDGSIPQKSDVSLASSDHDTDVRTLDSDDPGWDDEQLRKGLLHKTSLIESGFALLSPPHPTEEYIATPSKREHVVIHDRLYLEQKLPKPSKHTLRWVPSSVARDISIKEEKMARAWHKDKSWRKVIVKLEPEAHNNIVVRRRFSNAYGWAVVEHVVASHFGLPFNEFGTLEKLTLRDPQDSFDSNSSGEEGSAHDVAKESSSHSPSQTAQFQEEHSSTQTSLIDSDIDITWFQHSDMSASSVENSLAEAWMLK